MLHYIQHLVEPARLLLYWQARDTCARARYCVGQLLRTGDEVVLEYFHGAPDFVLAKQAGFKGYPAFKVEIPEHRHQVMEAFKRRLPPRSRSDFRRYLEVRAINPESSITDFALLGYSGAKLPNDGFELVHPFDDPPGEFELLLEVAGFRYETETAINDLQIGDRIEFIPEQMNQHDQRAIQLEANRKKVGYVPRGYLELFHRLREEGAVVRGQIHRLSGTKERPLVYVFAEVLRPPRDACH